MPLRLGQPLSRGGESTGGAQPQPGPGRGAPQLPGGETPGQDSEHPEARGENLSGDV